MASQREIVAAVQHSIWAHWMNDLFEACPRNEDGSVTIPAEKVERWQRQVKTHYSDLSPQEKASDLQQADKVLEALRHISGQ